MLKSVNGSSLIQPLSDSLTGLSVGLPAREQLRTIPFSLMISLYAFEVQTLPLMPF